MIVHNKLYEDLCAEVDHGSPYDAMALLLSGIAWRIEDCRANPVKLTDLVSILREDPGQLTKTVLRKG
ncbi:hypothetical protein L6654_08080 [Bradyrhizobium sp. WYCCWR 13023]|uniref:Uncharacterized protein n=1 Tax=Bradyrhizobium zhengyangense TaxID=2911009 RepID=A0A9X1U6E8_9BRAD|nr:hypothetical protein [Bradyrhizobium zhengyangense]MCG2626580.1 hypothetical protein [Bradyrhizobium zhengyangense]